MESSSEGRSGSRSRDRERKPIRTPVNRPKPLVLKPYSGDGTFDLTIKFPRNNFSRSSSGRR